MPKYKLEKPINGNQIFDTLERALTFINNNGFLKMQFTVMDDNENNGTYVVDKLKNLDNDNTIVKLIHKK
jgi:hypothetical protein